MVCRYCGGEMAATGGALFNTWTCYFCNHWEPEGGSYAIEGRPPFTPCNCDRCATPPDGPARKEKE